ncbi:hypothetical protein DFR70_1362 [Nocardia tenerifensis]|uniref:Uncharacterized protein n=1 Tax=Nocardia tenerifensis TaxID=228006 RepID=A0A318JRN1_9NOCA|nr:hypothetical protein [Nocardia tenerifensis]PXX52173.1 hypothetical protein DFR70_1362 [Nocardia tenerifensis]
MRIDSEILGQNTLEHSEDLQASDFLSGGEAWIGFRDGRIDAATFGVHGTENWGTAEIPALYAREELRVPAELVPQ